MKAALKISFLSKTAIWKNAVSRGLVGGCRGKRSNEQNPNGKENVYLFKTAFKCVRPYFTSQ